jgi:hypothetical protein
MTYGGRTCLHDRDAVERNMYRSAGREVLKHNGVVDGGVL